MKRLYTAYLTYPDNIDQTIRDQYGTLVSSWTNKRVFEFKPMIPLWKVILPESKETELIASIRDVDVMSLVDLKIKGYEPRVDSGYVFLVFDSSSSRLLSDVSRWLSERMHIDGAEDHMPYGFEPHTSLIKEDPSNISSILSSLSHDLDDAIFTPS